MYKQVVTIILVIVSVTKLYCQTTWVLQKHEDSIRISTSNLENIKFKSIKANFDVNATLTQLASMVLDIENYNEWQYNTVEAAVVKKVNDHELIYYTRVLAPWPVDDRDMIIHLTISQNSITKVLTIVTNSIPTYLPSKEDLVRVPMSTAKWLVTPINKTKLRIEYTIQIDPGGSVPAWMVNMVCTEAPYISFKNLRNKINAHQVLRLPFITD